MKDKYLYIINLVFILSCNPCNNCDINFNTIVKLDEIRIRIENKLEISQNELSTDDLEKILNQKELNFLKNLEFKTLKFFKNNEVQVYTFKNIKFKGIENLSKTYCSYYLFYSDNSSHLNEVSFYEGYNDCRVSREKLTKNWILVIQEQNCDN